MEKVSHLLSRIMLGLFLLVMAAALLLGGALNWQHKSYLAAFFAALVLVVLFCWADRRGKLGKLPERLGKLGCALLPALLCLGLNLAWACTHFVRPDGDYITFWITACAEATGEEMSNAFYVGLFPHIMGYASFLGLFLRLFGCHLAVAVGVNLLLTVLSDLLIFGICLRWGGLRAAFLGSLLWAICPSAIMFNTMVLSEPYYTCLLLLALWIVSGLEQRERAGKTALPLWIGGGILTGLVLRLVQTARPIAPVPIIALAIWILLLRGKGARDRGSWLRWGLFFALLVTAYVPLGWLWDAHLTHRIGQAPPSLPGYNIYVGFNPQTGGIYSLEDMNLLRDYRIQTGSAMAAQQAMLEEARNRILSGEIDFGRLLLTKLRVFLGHDEAGAYYTQALIPTLRFSLWSALSNLFFYAVAMLAILGALRLGRRGEEGSVLLVPLYVIGLTMAQMLVEVAARYHYSIVPILVILAACSRGEAKER